MTRLAEPIPASEEQALPGTRAGKPRAAVAVALCSWLLLAAAVGGCHRRAPAPQGKGGKTGTQAPTGTDKSGKAPAKAPKTGGATARTGGGTPANAPAGVPEAAGAGGGPPANAPASTATRAGAKGESPFPGQAGGARPVAQAAAPEAVNVVARRDPDTIPGVPKLSFPAPKRSPFRLEGVDEGPSTEAKQTGPGMTIRPQDLGKAPMDMGGVRPLPPVPYALQDEGRPGPVGIARTGEPGAAAAPPPALHLTGIINGAPRMAVIEGEKAHYIVREGDLVAGGYRVASISPYKVILLSGDSRSLVLRFGRKGG